MTVRTEEILKVIPEQGTGIFRCIFTDEDGNLVSPVSINWDLTALDGKVIAYNQAVAVPASTVYIVVSGTNARILDGELRYGERLLTVKAIYNSTYGSNLPINKQIKFRVQNLALVGYPIDVSVVDSIFTDDYLRSAEVA